MTTLLQYNTLLNLFTGALQQNFLFLLAASIPDLSIPPSIWPAVNVFVPLAAQTWSQKRFLTYVRKMYPQPKAVTNFAGQGDEI